MGEEGQLPLQTAKHHAKRLIGYTQLAEAMRNAPHKLKCSFGFRIYACSAVSSNFCFHSSVLAFETWWRHPGGTTWQSRQSLPHFITWVSSSIYQTYKRSFGGNIHTPWVVTMKCKSLTVFSRLNSLLNLGMSQLLSIWREGIQESLGEVCY